MNRFSCFRVFVAALCSAMTVVAQAPLGSTSFFATALSSMERDFPAIARDVANRRRPHRESGRPVWRAWHHRRSTSSDSSWRPASSTSTATPRSAPLSTAENMLTQGVTTEILNPDGGGSTDIAAQLSRSRRGRPGGQHRRATSASTPSGRDTMGPADRRATDADIAQMRTLVASGLDSGAWGVSAGLDYKPAYLRAGRGRWCERSSLRRNGARTSRTTIG